jgi:beta-galactosidase
MTKYLHLVVGVLWFSLFLIQSTSGQREIVSFDFGWKFRTGLTDWAAPDELPPKDTDPGRHPPEADPTYKYNPTSDWWDVQLPHDGLISNAPSQTACPDGCSGKSYIPRHVLWYRKQFSLPQEWEGTSLVTLEFEGSFRNTTVWINGNLVANHVCGYTPFRVPLDSPNFGETNQNTIAVFVDPDNGDAGGPSKGSGWWYEGGGLYRHVKLIKTQRQHLEVDSLFAKSDIQFDQRDGTALSAHLGLEVSVANDGAVDENVCVSFMVWDPDGVPIQHSAEVIQQLLPAGTSGRFSETLRLYFPELWTSSQPNLYKVTARIVNCQNNGTLLDQVSAHHGFRELGYDAERGFFLNKQHFKIRGFCDHDTFAVVGMAVPDRINLFRISSSNDVYGAV